MFDKIVSQPKENQACFSGSCPLCFKASYEQKEEEKTVIFIMFFPANPGEARECTVIIVMIK